MTTPFGHWAMIEHYRVETPVEVPEATWYALKMIKGVALYEIPELTEMRDYATTIGFTYGESLFQALIDMAGTVHGLYDPDNTVDIGSPDSGTTLLRPRTIYVGTSVEISTALGESGVLYLGNHLGSKSSIRGDGSTGNLILHSFHDIEVDADNDVNVRAGNNLNLYAGLAGEIIAHSQIAALYPDEQHHVATKAYVDNMVFGLDWQESVLSFWDASAGLPVAPSIGDRYICWIAGSGWILDSIYEWLTVDHVDQWVETVPNKGFALLVEDEGIQYMFNGTRWIQFSSLIDHHKLQNLNNPLYDDHPQYLRTDGTRILTGDQSMGGHNLTHVAQFIGPTGAVALVQAADVTSFGLPFGVGGSTALTYDALQRLVLLLNASAAGCVVFATDNLNPFGYDTSTSTAPSHSAGSIRLPSASRIGPAPSRSSSRRRAI